MSQEQKYIGDFGAPLDSAADKARVGLPLVLLALAVGLVVGLLVFALLRLSGFLTSFIWEDLRGALGWPFWFPLAACLLGGAVIGLWNWKVRVAPKPLEQVLAQVKATGSYQLEGGLLKNIVAFLLPLAFGGSVGPEAGLTGIIAGGCSWIGNWLKRAGLAAKSVADLTLSASLSAIFGEPFLGVVAVAQDGLPAADQVGYRRSAKLVLYTAAAFGAFAGALVIAVIPGFSGGLPRFGSIDAQPGDYAWVIALIAVAYAMALLFSLSTWACARLGRASFAKAPAFQVAAPLIAGLALGVVGMFLPNALFAGEEQAGLLMGQWTSLGAATLLLTGLAKAILTPLCLGLGWHGGNFFPLIFCGISVGYGMAALTGADPMLCVTVLTTALVAVVMRKPLLSLSLVVLCFPLNGLLWMGLAAIIGSALPLPSFLQKQRE